MVSAASSAEANARWRPSPVNARNKLNVAYANGCLILAALVGIMAESGAVFLLAFAALIAGGIASGEIRPRPRGR